MDFHRGNPGEVGGSDGISSSRKTTFFLSMQAVPKRKARQEKIQGECACTAVGKDQEQDKFLLTTFFKELLKLEEDVVNMFLRASVCSLRRPVL